jgi:hypothetical protein
LRLVNPLSMDRVVRFLQALGQASTSRVLNLGQIARLNRDDPDHAARPMFLSPAVNTAFLLKQPMRADETYLFSAARRVATKIILPFDLDDLRAGGHSILIDQRGFVESLRAAGHYNSENLQRDLIVLRLMNSLPSLDPFLLREHLCNNGIEVAPCYFEISAGDQARMHQYVAGEISKLIQLASGGANANSSTDRMVSALLSTMVDEKLEPLRVTLGLNGTDFREGVFSWRGFLYYKWSMNQFWPDVMKVLRQIREIRPHGAITPEQQAFLPGARRNIIELVRDCGTDVNKVLEIYDSSFEDLVAHQAPKTFRDFLLSAPYMFLDLGEKMGAISHLVNFWRHRFPPGAPALIDAEELSIIFQDFAAGFAEREEERPALKKPLVVEGR